MGYYLMTLTLGLDGSLLFGVDYEDEILSSIMGPYSFVVNMEMDRSALIAFTRLSA